MSTTGIANRARIMKMIDRYADNLSSNFLPFLIRSTTVPIFDNATRGVGSTEVLRKIVSKCSFAGSTRTLNGEEKGFGVMTGVGCLIRGMCCGKGRDKGGQV